jgi:rhodanese-related sulfurtransferase
MKMHVIDLDTDAVKAGLNNGTILLIDVREIHEFAGGHIPGSVSMPLSSFDPASIPQVSGKHVVFSCAAGVRSRRALEFAQAAGLDLAEHYIGGFKGWLMEGGPVDEGLA